MYAQHAVSNSDIYNYDIGTMYRQFKDWVLAKSSYTLLDGRR